MQNLIEEEDPSSEEDCLMYSTLQQLPPANMITLKPQLLPTDIQRIYNRNFRETGIINTHKPFLEDSIFASPTTDPLPEQPIQTLQEYYDQNKHKVVYSRFKNINLSKVPESQRLYFSTLHANLKKKCPRLYFRGEPLVESELTQRSTSGITFDSNFESGNLFLALKNDCANTYDLILQNDINTRGNTQWFYFSVSGVPNNTTITFRIINHVKSGSLFNHGLQPAVYSKQAQKIDQTEWFRGGFGISYKRSSYRREYPSDNRARYYQLQFSYTFLHDNDTVYFAHSYPYSYSDLLIYLNTKSSQIRTAAMMNRKVLCQTNAGNRCEVITITSSTLNRRNHRKGIIIMARQHPGEPQGSYVLEGLINFLTSDDEVAENLRTNFIFKIIPMLNIDGVIVGNYRCGLDGNDLNRRWNKPNKRLHPTIYYAKKYIKGFARERQVLFICDLHGHSRQLYLCKMKGTFFYGCSYTAKPNSIERLLAYQISKISSIVNFNYCTFRAERDKHKTARLSLWRELKINWVYTYETSFYGQDQRHYQISDYKDCGKNLLVALNMLTKDSFCKGEQDAVTVSNLLMEELQNIPVNENQDEIGSDSSPSEGNLSEDELIPFYHSSTIVKKRNPSPQKEKPFEKTKEKLVEIEKIPKPVHYKIQNKFTNLKIEGDLRRSTQGNIFPPSTKNRLNSLFLSNRKSSQQIPPQIPTLQRTWENIPEMEQRIKTVPTMIDKCVQTDPWLYKQWIEQMLKLKHQRMIVQKQTAQRLGNVVQPNARQSLPEQAVITSNQFISQAAKGRSLDKYDIRQKASLEQLSILSNQSANKLVLQINPLASKRRYNSNQAVPSGQLPVITHNYNSK